MKVLSSDFFLKNNKGNEDQFIKITTEVCVDLNTANNCQFASKENKNCLL